MQPIAAEDVPEKLAGQVEIPSHHLTPNTCPYRYQYISNFLFNVDTDISEHPVLFQNNARVQNCPVVTISNTLFGLCLSFWPFSFCIFVFLSFFVFFVFLSFCLFVFLSFCLFVFLSYITLIKCLKGSQVSKVTLCVKILKWQ